MQRLIGQQPPVSFHSICRAGWMCWLSFPTKPRPAPTTSLPLMVGSRDSAVPRTPLAGGLGISLQAGLQLQVSHLHNHQIQESAGPWPSSPASPGNPSPCHYALTDHQGPCLLQATPPFGSASWRRECWLPCASPPAWRLTWRSVAGTLWLTNPCTHAQLALSTLCAAAFLQAQRYGDG